MDLHERYIPGIEMNVKKNLNWIKKNKKTTKTNKKYEAQR